MRERGGEVLGCLERRGTFSFAIDDDQDERLAPPEIRALWTWKFEFGLAQSPGHGTPAITILPPRAWSRHRHAAGRHAHMEARGRRLADYPTRTWQVDLLSDALWQQHRRSR